MLHSDSMSCRPGNKHRAPAHAFTESRGNPRSPGRQAGERSSRGFCVCGTGRRESKQCGPLVPAIEKSHCGHPNPPRALSQGLAQLAGRVVSLTGKDWNVAVLRALGGCFDGAGHDLGAPPAGLGHSGSYWLRTGNNRLNPMVASRTFKASAGREVTRSPLAECSREIEA